MSTQSSIIELQFRKDAIITLPISSALDKYDQLNSVVDIARANLLLVEEELNLAQDDYKITKNQLDSNNAKKQLLANNLYILQIAKTSIESIFSNKQAVSKGKINDIQDSLSEANTKLNTETNAANKDAIIKQINGYYIQIQEEQNFLSLIYADYQQDTEIVNFKINQINTDLQELETKIIPDLSNVLEVKNQRLDRFNNESESLQKALTDAEKSVQDFLQQNSYLESKDYSSQFIQDAINNVNQKVAIFETEIDALKSDVNASIPKIEATEKQLQEYKKYSDESQKYYTSVVQEESEFQKERTIIETTADRTNESVNLSLQTDSVQAYKDLSTQLITQLKDLVDIWVDNLRDNYKLTIDIWESSQDYSTSFDLLTTYIEKTLAEPHEEYYLDELQLDEAIKIQESTVNRRDAFAENVDYVENSFDLYKKQDEEIEKISNILQNFRELTDYESQYANLQKSYRELEQKKQSLETDYAQKQNIRQQKEQSLQDAQQAYNSKIDSATTTIFNANKIYFGGRGGGGVRDGINASDARTIAIGIANSTNQSAVKGVTDALRNELKQSYSLLSSIQQKKDTAVNNETSARQSLEAFLAEFPVTKNSLDNQFNELNPLFSNELLEDIEQLPQRYDLHSEDLKVYITQQIDFIELDELGSVQKLRIEIANLQYSQTQSIRQQKEQKIKDAQQAYNSKIDSATTTIVNANKIVVYYGGRGGGGSRVVDGINASDARTIAIGIANSTNQSAVKGVTDALRNELKQSYSLLSNTQQEKDTAVNNENLALQTLQNLQTEKIDNVSFDALIYLLNNELQNSSSSELKAHVKQEIINLKQDKIASLQNLRLEVAYLDTVEEQNSEKLNAYLNKYQIIQTSGNISWESKETQIDALRNEYFPGLNDAQVLSELQQGIIDAIRNSQQKIEELKTSVTQKQAEAAAALSQADWYEEQANFHWDNSRKQGPTWSEQRTVKGKSGKSSTETIIHVDHDWIIWDTYTKEFTALRQYAENLLKGVETDAVKQDTFTSILEQWNKANDIADQAAITQDQLLQLLNQLEAERELNTDRKAQISEWEKLLPALKAQLQQAIQDAEGATGNVDREWTEYEDSKQHYQTALDDVLKSRAKLQTEAQELQQEIATAQRWVTQQNTYLTDDITEVKALLEQLQTQRDSITKQLATAPVDSRIDLFTKQALLDYSIQLLTQKQTILTAEQASFTQKQTLLNTQQQLIETEHNLFDAYLISPGDISNLENLLIDTRATLAEVERLAEEAKASSEALTAVMKDLQITLKLQNDKYLAAIKDKQQTLQELIQETELKENYTAQAGTIQRELNSIDSQLLEALQLANDAGSQEAAKLLEVARNENIATAAEIYYRDYRDLANDNGGSCSRGVARPEDLQLADYYYNQMVEYRRLQSLAQQQAEQFLAAREATEYHIQFLQGKKADAYEELLQLNQQIANSQGNIEELQQELKIAEFRVDALSKFQEVTQKTLVQLLSVEQLNLAQAKLEQEIARNRENVIDEEVKNRLERERLDIERDRYIAIAKLEQLNQLKTEDVLQQAINNLRFDLGLNPIDDIIRFADWKGQLAGILADIEALQQNQPSLPEATKTLLNNTLQDIQNALEGEESLTIQDNLLRTANALIEQSNKLNREVATLQQEEQRYLDLLTQSETDLKSATKALYDEIKKSGVLDSEISEENLQILYEIGYAKGAIDESSYLAQRSREILEEVIAGRIEQRKAREKAAFNEIFGTVTLVISAVAAVFTAGASLAVNAATTGTATVFGVSATTISSIATTLQAVGASLSAVQAAYNGDLSGAIFNAGMAALGFASISGAPFPSSFQFGNVKTFKDVQQVASSAYSAYKAGESGDGLSAFLNIINASLPLSGLSEYNYLSQATFSIQSGVQLAKEGDWLAATSSFLAGAFSLGSGLNGGQGSFGITVGASTQVLDIISTVEVATKLISGVQGITKDGSLEGWLTGIQNISNTLTGYAGEQETIDKLTDYKKRFIKKRNLEEVIEKDFLKGKNEEFVTKYGDRSGLIDPESKKQSYTIQNVKISENTNVGLIIKGEFDPNKPTNVIIHGFQNSATDSPWISELQDALSKDYNTIVVDWSELAQNINCIGAAIDTKTVGIAVADALKETLNIKFENTNFIGHSLGAQIAANIGEYTKKKEGYGTVKSILGLDPARPSFERNYLLLSENPSNEGRLDASDADKVLIIHSDYDSVFSLGYRKAAGSEDIFLNRTELDSLKKESGGIDHSSAYWFVIKALKNGYSLDDLNKFNEKENNKNGNIQPQTSPNLNSEILSDIKLYFEIQSYLKEFNQSSNLSFGASENNPEKMALVDPLVIDLDGNGVKVSDAKNSSVFFDMDGDGYAENTAWVSPLDGVLTVDLNHDGIINNITEVFSEYYGKNSITSGLQALASFDSNNNGIISATDSRFNEILIWQDLNQNGVSETNELKTLSQQAITSISLNGIASENIQYGNIIRTHSTFNRNDGTSGEIADVAFLVNSTGFKVIQTNQSTNIIAENDSATSLIIFNDTANHTLNLTQAGVQVAFGNAGNDELYATETQNVFLSGAEGDDTLTGGSGDDLLLGNEGNDKLYLGAEDGVVDIVKYAFGDGADTLYQFMRGVGGDQIQFTGITNIDVVTLGTSTLLHLGDGTIGNAGFGTGELLVRLSGTSGFSDTDVNVNLFGTNFLFS